jgi:hypothetical protein
MVAGNIDACPSALSSRKEPGSCPGRINTVISETAVALVFMDSSLAAALQTGMTKVERQ